MRANNVLEYHKQSLTGVSGVSSRYQSTDGSVNREDCAYEASGENENSTGNWTSGHACYTLVKSLSMLALRRNPQVLLLTQDT